MPEWWVGGWVGGRALRSRCRTSAVSKKLSGTKNVACFKKQPRIDNSQKCTTSCKLDCRVVVIQA